MRTHYSLPLILLILFKYAKTTSIPESVSLPRISNMNPRPMIIEQPMVHLHHESIETDQEDTAEDAELSPSELIETHVLPETSDPDDSAGAGGTNAAGPGVQRVRRRRRRRRRKRPKPTVATAPVSEPSEAPAAPGKPPNSFDTYYGLAEEEIRRKPFKYVRGEADENVDLTPPLGQNFGDSVDGYPRKRVPKRRRRPLKRPIDDYPPIQPLDDENTNNNNDDDENNTDGGESLTKVNKSSHDHRVESTTAAVPTTTPTTSTSIHSRKPDFSKLTTAANRNKSSPPSSTENTFHSTKTSPGPIQQDSENSLKRQKNLASVGQKIQHEPDDNFISPNHQRKQIEQNVVRLGHEESPKTLENKKEFFKPRRLPPTWAILGHSKLGQSATTKNESILEKNSNQGNPSKKDVTRHGDQIVSSQGQSETITAKSNLIQESEQRSSATSFKISTTVLPPIVEENETMVRKKSNSSKTGPGEHFSFPIITTYDPEKGQQTSRKEIDVVNSNTSAFLSSNDQRLTIIYVPCNQTVTSVQADQLLKNGAIFRPTEENIRSNDEASEIDSSTQESRKISTTRLPPPSEHTSQSEESVSETIEDAKLTSTARSTTSVSSSVTSQSHPVREAKHYQEDIISSSKSKSKSELDKEDLPPSWQVRKPHPSSGLILPSSKPFPGSSKEIIISYTSTTNSPPSLFSYHNIDSADENISLHLRNRNSTTEGNEVGTSDALLHRKTPDENPFVNRIKHHQHQQPPHTHHVERKKLPLAVKSAIIISGAVLALAVLGFFALLLSCKIRQAKSRMKCHRQLYRDQFQSSEFRQSSRSTSPVMSKSNYNTRNFTNNMQPANVAAAAAASNRNYYLWQTLRKTFQYD